MTEATCPEADRLDGFPHPRETERQFGQEAAEETLYQAINGGRLHHAWLLTGPKGVGKATLAWRASRYLLAQTVSQSAELLGTESPTNLFDVDPEHPVSRRIAAMSEPGLMLIRRPWDAERKRLKSQITVEEIRRLNAFFGLSAAEGGHRVVIIDCADEMNSSAANALLKVLEEPPRNAILFLVSHRPSRLLPTIRSRCRELRLGKLGHDDLARAMRQAGSPDPATEALAELAGGSVGDALRLQALDGVGVYSALVELLSSTPRMDRRIAASLAETTAQRGAEERLDLTVRLIDTALSRLALAGAGQPAHQEAAKGESAVLSRLAPNLRKAQAWADLNRDIGQRLSHGLAVNIDPGSLLLDAFLRINETAGQP